VKSRRLCWETRRDGIPYLIAAVETMTSDLEGQEKHLRMYLDCINFQQSRDDGKSVKGI
jgi:hypothetical protein